MKETVSIERVAHSAGVSIATVSRVMNNSKPVSDKTRERVEAAIVALDFRANPFGRSLSSGKSRLLLVLVPGFANPYYAEIIAGASAVASKAGYRLLPIDMEDTAAQAHGVFDAVYNGLADGVINLIPSADQQELEADAKRQPWVNCSEFLPGHDIPYVSIDHAKAASDAVQYLLNRGHRRIALISSDERYLYARQRREGYEAALTRAGIEVDPQLIVLSGGTSYAHGSQAAVALLSSVRLPTAVFAVSDTLAVGAMKTFRKAALQVPKDVAVMGFDNTPIAEMFDPGLSTVGQPMHELGGAAASMLLDRMDGKSTESRTLPHHLVLRESA
jgi:LacI family repressor for deo operon, udp, cdd, tsx, nupC, and nupG